MFWNQGLVLGFGVQEVRVKGSGLYSIAVKAQNRSPERLHRLASLSMSCRVWRTSHLQICKRFLLLHEPLWLEWDLGHLIGGGT